MVHGKRCAALVVCLCLLLTTALGEARLVPQWDAWALDDQPITVTVSADVTSRMPFDEDRTAQLNRLLSHLSLRMDRQVLQAEEWSRIAVLVDGTEAVALARRDTSEASLMQLSCVPSVTYTAAANADIVSLLLGAEAAQPTFAGLDEQALTLLSDGCEVLRGVKQALGAYMTEKAVKTSISKMGTAREQLTFTIPAEDAATLGATLANLCGEGPLKVLLGTLMFSGKQQLTVWRSESGAVLRALYEGKCGTDEEHLRKVTLNWTMRRDDDDTRDTFSLKTPAVKGSDRDTLTISRVLTTSEDGSAALTGSFTYETVASKEKRTVSGEVDLTNAMAETGSALTGTITLKQVAPDDTSTRLTLTPTLALSGAQDAPKVDGTIGVATFANKKAQDEATLTVSLGVGDYFDWKLTDQEIALGTMGEDARLLAGQEAVSAAATALMRPLVLLPMEDAAFLSADLSEEAWQRIVEAAAAGQSKEVQP